MCFYDKNSKDKKQLIPNILTWWLIGANYGIHYCINTLLHGYNTIIQKNKNRNEMNRVLK